MRPITDEKIDELTRFMEKNKLDLIFLADWENARDVNMRYMTGHPMDAYLIISASGETTLIPWDVDLAKDHATADTLITEENSRRKYDEYVKAAITTDNPLIGVNANIPYRLILSLKKKISGIKFIEDPFALDELFKKLRSTKSSQELDKLVKAAEIGNKTIKVIEKFAREEKDGTENDLSFLVAKKMREFGAEDNAFPSLVANVTRSHMIHCHPSAGNNKYSETGLALIDYGANYEGYVSDITIPLSFGKLNAEQEKIKKTVFKAYDAAIEAIDLGVPLWKISKAANDVIEEAGYHMPHGLGHGLGLAVHDSPGVRQKPDTEEGLEDWTEVVVEEGMVFTIEPGVYIKGQGGQRLENDVMIRNGKVVVYTNSHPLEID